MGEVEMRRLTPAGRVRRGQAEVIGGLIVLTIIFLLVVPLLLSAYRQAVETTNVANTGLAEASLIANERLEIEPLDPNNEVYLRLGWIPGIYVINRGTVEVELMKMYLINIVTNNVDYVLDLTTLRPEVLTPDHVVRYIALNATPENPLGDPLPPAGEPIELNPGDRLLVVFNLVNPEDYVVSIESARGVLHPVGAGGDSGRIVPEAGGDGAGVGAAGAEALLRPIFAPLGGFKIEGAAELQEMGTVDVWKPGLRVYFRSLDDDIPAIWYRTTFIYDDPDPEHAGLSLVYIEVLYSRGYLVAGDSRCFVGYYDRIYIHGYIGAYYLFTQPIFLITEANYVYINGYAMRVEVHYYDSRGRVQGEPCIIEASTPRVEGNPDTVRFDVDFDGNGVQEMIVFSYYNVPSELTFYNVDADLDGSLLNDVIVWQYVVARDISSSDYIRVSGKINYYWTATFYNGCPSTFRPLKVFSIAIFRFDEATGKWVLEHWKDYFYSEEKPRQFQFTAIFPVKRENIYRVGVIFYDYYMNFLINDREDCYIDFTYTVEFLDVEFGIVNPYFRETPPVYIIAIPDPNLISGIGEESYASWAGVPLDQAKVEAQRELLEALDVELNFVGIGNYVVIDSVSELCNVLFPDRVAGNIMKPPKDAIIIWLQGDVSISDVTNTPGSPCGISESTLRDYIANYGWVFVQATGLPFWNVPSVILGIGTVVLRDGGDAAITLAGQEARAKYIGYAMLDVLTFNTLVEVTNIGLPLKLDQATFYQQAGGEVYGHIAFTISGADTGAYLVMHIVPVWGQPGPTPTTVAQLALFGGLEAYNALNP
jgi:hypothetical protein